MKIYNKKGFAASVLLVVLGVFDLVMLGMEGRLHVREIMIIAAMFALGYVGMKRSLSQKMAGEDRGGEADEQSRPVK